jgi:hypothetical protein
MEDMTIPVREWNGDEWVTVLREQAPLGRMPQRHVPPVGIPFTPRDVTDNGVPVVSGLPGSDVDWRYTAYSAQGALADMRTALPHETMRTGRAPAYVPVVESAPADDSEAERQARIRQCAWERKTSRQVRNRLELIRNGGT